MKKIFQIGSVFLLLAALIGLARPALAHEIIPAQLQEFLANNPAATPAEIQAFYAATSSTPAKSLLTATTATEDGALATAGRFILLGIEHVLGGTDHVLFVISLLLVFGSLKDILKLSGAFTVAHSITLILSGSLLLSISSRIVEPLIALSIAYVALTSVFLRQHAFFQNQKNKLATVFFFGLFHGLGFAGALKELAIPAKSFLLSLVTFNIGIELGQLIVIAAVLPILYLIRKKTWYQTFISIVAVGIAFCGLVWAVQRIVG